MKTGMGWELPTMVGDAPGVWCDACGTLCKLAETVQVAGPSSADGEMRLCPACAAAP